MESWLSYRYWTWPWRAVAGRRAMPRRSPRPRRPAPPVRPRPRPKPTRTEKPTSDIHDCYDGNRLLKVSDPVRIPLNKKKFHYSSMQVVEVTPSGLRFHVPYPNGGGTRPSIEVKLISMKRGKGLLSLTAQKHL